MRKFPIKGFYVWSLAKFCKINNFSEEKTRELLSKETTDDIDVVYVSGTTIGNYYFNPKWHGPQWNKLSWTCVPSLKESLYQYDYVMENPTSVPVPT
jgi:hypothetical protein